MLVEGYRALFKALCGQILGSFESVIGYAFDASMRQKKSLLDGASLRERMVLTNVKNYSKLGEKLNLFKHIYGRFCGC